MGFFVFCLCFWFFFSFQQVFGYTYLWIPEIYHPLQRGLYSDLNLPSASPHHCPRRCPLQGKSPEMPSFKTAEINYCIELCFLSVTASVILVKELEFWHKILVLLSRKSFTWVFIRTGKITVRWIVAIN